MQVPLITSSYENIPITKWVLRQYLNIGQYLLVFAGQCNYSFIIMDYPVILHILSYDHAQLHRLVSKTLAKYGDGQKSYTKQTAYQSSP